MSLATETAKRASERDVLLRMKPGYDVTDLLTTTGHPTYTCTMPYKPVLVLEDGVSRSFSWVESTQVLTVTLTVSASETNPVIAYFYMFAATGVAKYLDEDDPTGSISTVAEWLPTISTPPTVKSSVGDVLRLRFYSSSSKIVLDNANRYYDQYFNRIGDTEKLKIAFVDKEVLVWFGFNDEYTLSFYGTIVKADISGSRFTLSLKDNLRKLRKTCLFGDDQDENYATGTEVQKTRQNKPIPFVYGASMPEANVIDDYGVISLQSERENSTGWFQTATLTDADYGDYTGSGKNKTLLLGRTNGSLEGHNVSFSFSLGGVSDIVVITGSSGSTNYRAINIGVANTFRVSVYCRLKITWSVSGDESMPLWHVGYGSGILWISNSHPTETVTAVVRERPFAIAANVEYTPGSVALFAQDVTQGTRYITGTSGANKSHKFVANAPVYKPDYPHYFTLFLADTPTVEYVAEDLLQKAGYTNTSISSSNTTPEFLSLPYAKATDFKTYDSYLSTLLAPKLKTLKMSKTDPLDIDLVDIESTIDEANQPSTIHEIDETDIFEGSLRCSVDYQDIANDLELVHAQCENSYMKEYLVNQNYTSKQIAQLYGVENKETVNNTSTAKAGVVKADEFWEIAKEPKIVYEMTLAVKWYDLIPGDYIKVTSSQLPTAYDDGSEWVLLFITDVSKSIGGVSVTARTVEYTT